MLRVKYNSGSASSDGLPNVGKVNFKLSLLIAGVGCWMDAASEGGDENGPVW